VSSAAERRFKREKVDIRVRLRRWEEKEDAATVMRTFELSEGGMSVYAPDKLDVGTFVLLAFSLPPEDKALRIRAVVRNRRGFRCGLQFIDLPDADRLEIAGYLGSIAGSAASRAQ
jgi:c-di-GMP-binding flagellar brake protein YcgR